MSALDARGFDVLPTTREFVKAALEEVGFADVSVTAATKEELGITAPQPPHSAYVFVSGIKKVADA